MTIHETGIREYRRILESLRLHLASFGVRDWAERLERWISELDVAFKAGHGLTISDHIARSQRATGGMGSIGDVFISPQAGDAIPDDERTIRIANERLAQLVAALYQQTLSLLGGDVRQPRGERRTS